MTPRTILRTALFFFLTLSLVVSCARQRTVRLDIQCDRDIKSASRQLNDGTNTFDKATRRTIQNLIQAAKIQQQHGKFPDCIDKAQRALTLLKVDPQMGKTK